MNTKAMRLAWEIFRIHGNHRKHPFSKCLEDAWKTLKVINHSKQPKKAKKVFSRDTVTFPINMKNSPKYAWQLDMSKMVKVEFFNHSDLSLDEGMRVARVLKTTGKLSDARGFKNSSIYRQHLDTRSFKTWNSRQNTQTLLRSAEGKARTKAFSKSFGDWGAYAG
jgi:hypothetical protein